MPPLTIPTAEPFFFPGGNTGCLLIHGFTGAPKEMRWMGEYLAGKGYTVLGIRLTGHATRKEDLLRVTWQDWVVSVEDGLNILKGACRQVFTIGLSMGGVLSMIAAAHYPVSGAVGISTPYALPRDWRLRYIRLIARFMPYMSKGQGDWHNPEAALDHVDYPANVTRSFGELAALVEYMRAGLPRVRVPVLLVQSTKDPVVAPQNMEMLYSQLGTPVKEMMWVENSGHVVPREPDRLAVFEATHAFIQSVLEKA